MSLRPIFRLGMRSSREVIHLLLGVGPCCRFSPTCSRYAAEAFETHGIFKGFGLTLKRLIRCHPWGAHGWDPVPKKEVIHGS